MNEATQWQFALAERIGRAYAENPKAQVVMIAGSTGRGTADRYSDLEIDIYWSEPPTDDERRAAVERSGCDVLEICDYEENEWSEDMSFGGFHASTSAFLIETMESYLTEVIDQYSTAQNPQIQLYSLLHSAPLVGNEIIERWRNKATAYPDGLVHAMLHENLEFDGFGHAEEVLAIRNDTLALYTIFCNIEQQVLGSLLALNHLYLPNPRFKSMDELIAEMDIVPPFLSARLKQAFRSSQPEAVRNLHSLIDDVFILVQRHVPDFDIIPYRERVQRRRGVWEHAPDGI